MSEFVVDEGSAAFVTFTFRDEDGNLITPSTVEWRLDDLTNDANIVDWTVITPDTSVSVQCTGAHNSISAESKQYELREVSVRIDNGLATQAYKSKRYKVKNLRVV